MYFIYWNADAFFRDSKLSFQFLGQTFMNIHTSLIVPPLASINKLACYININHTGVSFRIYSYTKAFNGHWLYQTFLRKNFHVNYFRYLTSDSDKETLIFLFVEKKC